MALAASNFTLISLCFFHNYCLYRAIADQLNSLWLHAVPNSNTKTDSTESVGNIPKKGANSSACDRKYVLAIVRNCIKSCLTSSVLSVFVLELGTACSHKEFNWSAIAL